MGEVIEFKKIVKNKITSPDRLVEGWEAYEEACELIDICLNL